MVMIATYRLHLRHLSYLLLISKAADTIEAAGGIQGGSDFKRMKQFQNYEDLFQKCGGVVRRPFGCQKCVAGGRDLARGGIF